MNQPYDESLEVNDEEEVASTFSPSPRPTLGKTSGSKNPGTFNLCCKLSRPRYKGRVPGSSFYPPKKSLSCG